MKFSAKKGKLVEAMYWDGSVRSAEEIKTWAGEAVFYVIAGVGPKPMFEPIAQLGVFDTHQGQFLSNMAVPGWVVRFPNGSLACMSVGQFLTMYEETE